MSEPYWSALGGGVVDYEGAWSAGTAYAAGDVVTHNGITYLAVNPSTGVTPGSSGGTMRTRYPIAINTPRTTSLGGNAFWTAVGLTGYDFGHWEFVRDVVGIAYGLVWIPERLPATPDPKIILALAANATAGVTRMMAGTAAIADGESINPASIYAEAYQDVTVPAVAYTRKDVVFPVTPALAAGDILMVGVYHDGAHANDTLAANTLLIGAWLDLVAA